MKMSKHEQRIRAELEDVKQEIRDLNQESDELSARIQSADDRESLLESLLEEPKDEGEAA